MGKAEVVEAYYTSEADKIMGATTTKTMLFVNGKLIGMECVSGERISDRMQKEIVKYGAVKK